MSMAEGTTRWLRVFDTVLGGTVVHAVLAWVAYSLVRQRGIGHRMLLWLAVANFSVRAVADLGAAVYLHRGGGRTVIAWAYLASAILGAVFVCMVLSARDNLLITLQTSEFHDRIRKDRADDLAQTKLNIEYINAVSLEKSEALVRIQKSA